MPNDRPAGPAKSGPARGTKKEKRPAKVETNRRPPARPPGRRTAANPDLAAIVNPATAVGAKIADDATMPSCTFKTVKRYTVTTESLDVNPRGVHYYAICGNMLNSVLKVANDGQNISLMAAVSDDFPAAFIHGNLSDLVTTETLQSVSEVFSDLRMVSLQVEWIPSGAALSASGIVNVGRFGRGQWPAQIDSVNAQGDAAEGLASSIGSNGTGFDSISAVCDACTYEGSAVKPTIATTFPQDEVGRRYRSMTGSYMPLAYDTNQPSQITPALTLPTSQFNAVGWENIAGIDENTIYYLPTIMSFTPAYIATGLALAAGDDRYRPTTDDQYANTWLAFVFRGLPNSTTNGELRVVANWEALPRQNHSAIMSPTPSPSVPSQLAHAENIASQLPAAYDPTTPDAPNTRLYEAASSVASGKAPPPQPKEKSGWSSTLKDIGSIVSTMAPLALALL